MSVRPDVPKSALVEELCDRFARIYGQPPQAIWRAPGRVNIIGEHTDYNEGFVLPMALSKGVTVCAAARSDHGLMLTSRQGGSAVVDLDDLAPGSVAGWAAYAAGVAWALRQAGYDIQGASVAIDSDLTAGVGLSSSAALECAVALALTDLSGVTVPRTELARIARQAENDFVGVPTGIMDQFAALLCRSGHALLIDCRTECAAAVPLDFASAGRCLMIIDTRVRHALTDGRYAERNRECEAAARTLGVRSLRDVAEDQQLASIPSAVIRRRARHVLQENCRVLKAAELLHDGQLPAIGKLMTASHASLRDDFQVSWPQADAAVDAALSACADGARMTGGGFGGSVIALVPVSLRQSVVAAVRRRFSKNNWREPTITSAMPSDGASRIR
jgi:galactokinase